MNNSTRREEFQVKLEYWQKRLLDLGGRNRLIHFRNLKTGNVQIELPTSDELVNKMISTNKLTRLVRERDDGKSLSSSEALISGVDDDLARSLYYIRLKARTALEERGVNVLYLAFGFLYWYEAESSEDVIRSPLFLMPVQLKRSAADNPHQLDYVFSPLEDELEVNTSLVIRIEKDFGIDLSSVTLPDWESSTQISIKNLLTSVSSFVESKPRWKVVDEVYLSIFTYQKLAMYQDIIDLEKSLFDNDVIKAIAGLADYNGPDGILTDPRQVDTNELPSNTFQVLDADSSQQVVIANAKKGQSLVIQGPPGTGKSQTITNLIAEFLAAGKTVLFVSAKMAALEVVMKRLDEVGLSRYCLEMHSDRPNKKSFYSELDAAWSQHGEIDPSLEDKIRELDRLEQLRNQLNNYIAELQTKKTKLSYTPYQVYGELAKLSDAPVIRCKIPDPIKITSSRFDKCLDVVRQISNYTEVIVQYEDHPWFGCTRDYVSFQDKEEIIDLLDSSKQAIIDMRRGAELLVKILPVEHVSVNLLSELIKIGSKYRIDILNLNLNSLLRELRDRLKSWKRFIPAGKELRQVLRCLKKDVIIVEKGWDYLAYNAAKDDLNWILRIMKKTAPGVKIPCEISNDQVDEFKDWVESNRDKVDLVVQYAEKLGQFLFNKKSIKSKSGPLFDLTLSDLAARFDKMIDGIDQLEDWIGFRNGQQEAIRLGIGDFIESAISADVSSSDFQAGFRKRFFINWIDEIVRNTPILRSFSSRDMNALIEEFQRLDKQQLRIARERITSKIQEHYPQQVYSATKNHESAVLLREINKQRAHMPIRKLFAKIQNLLLRLKPCLMMSPLTVSTYFKNTSQRFDVVIFDEASQILPEDALASIVRADQVIIAGDDQQLPPTDFFRSFMEDSLDESLEDVEGFDSILSICSAVLPNQMLNWHYRSHHQNLIAFSNYHFYDNKLQIFPSAAVEDNDLGVSLELVKGTYDARKSRTNQVEAEVIAKAVVDHAKQMSGDSLGVVAFSEAQQNEVLDKIEMLRLFNPEISLFLDTKGLDSFFVKNLENVQGDERDVMFFTIGYGPQKDGTISRNFGPLNRLNGERRLNVAVTRARKRVKVFSSMAASDLDIRGLRHRGPKLLKSYLDYAVNGPESLGQQEEITGVEPQSPFEVAVIRALQKHGYDVEPQVGVSKYVIDIGVIDYDNPGRYILGIECDGATYHSSFTARERDRLRQEVLESKYGWRIHRIWSRDWFHNPEREISKIEDAISNAQNSPPEDSHHEEPSENSNDVNTESRQGPTTLFNLIRPHCDVFRPVDINNLPWQWRNKPNLLYNNNNHVQHIVNTIINSEGPITDKRCMKLVANYFGITSVGRKVKNCIELAIARLKSRGEMDIRNHKRIDDKTLVSTGVTSGKLRPRLPRDGSQRNIKDIPIEEIVFLIRLIMPHLINITRIDLTREIGRMLGFKAAGSSIRQRVDYAVKLALEDGILVEEDGTLKLSD